MSPAGKVTVVIVRVVPFVSVMEPCALRNPLAVAVIVYVPAGTVKMKVPFELAFSVTASELSALYKRMVTGLLAITCPAITGAGKGVGVDVGNGVEVGSGVEVDVNVGVGTLPTVKVAAPVDGILTRVPFPFETRAVHSITA